jgi:DnaJ-class molecular chaperone
VSDDELDRIDYYELLAIDAGASADAIRNAFHAFALRFHPDRYASSPPEERDRAAAIYRRGAEAYRALMDPNQRRRYDEGLSSGQRRLNQEEVGFRRQIPTGKLAVTSPRARPFASKAQAAYAAGDYKTAKLNLKMALQYEPENKLLTARLADVEQKLKPG